MNFSLHDFRRPAIWRWGAFMLLLGVLSVWVRPAEACGGLFCQNEPVTQAAERIIFTDNGDGTITTIVQINYTGPDVDFSWILPIPTPITAEDVAVPELAEEAFTELHRLTDVEITAPERPSCTERREIFVPAMGDMALESESVEDGVTVFASGEVGPYAFDVIGSGNNLALINWLTENNYRVDPPMEPLINLYVEEEFVFIAMKLLPDQGADQISPIQITYEAEAPMIPLRLTAVAANPNMGIFVWFFSDKQAIPANFEHMQILDGEIAFTDFGGNNYAQLIGQRADALGGRAFITEYAGPSFDIEPNALNGLVTFNPVLNDLAESHPYMTRLYTVINPEEMLVDPEFEYVAGDNVSNIRDLWGMRGLYDCERDRFLRYTFSDAIDTQGEDGRGVRPTPGTTNNMGTWITWGLTLIPVAGLVFLFQAGSRRRDDD